ncbi:response regulator [Bdellovibrio sp. GT3]|uniref:response regulator n=1 Tax=Bdellovibrio sp. GT3 TaxID=3136282 RepID=UPI0030F098D4
MIHIVVVDDEADTHLLYKLKFKKFFADLGGVKLVSFLSALDCLNYLRVADTKVDLIMSDINMPEMDGFELLQEVRKSNTTLPFYVVSAYESSEFRNRAEQLGAQRFLSKPVDFHALGEALKSDLNLSL